MWRLKYSITLYHVGRRNLFATVIISDLIIRLDIQRLKKYQDMLRLASYASMDSKGVHVSYIEPLEGRGLLVN